METLEDAPDPFFGMMSVDPRLPSPFDIPQVGLIPPESQIDNAEGECCPCIRHLLEAAPPERVEEIPPEVPTEPRKPDRILVTALPPEAITIQEAEPIRMLQIEGERDIPEVSRRDLDLLIAEEDEAILLEARRLQQLKARLALEDAPFYAPSYLACTYFPDGYPHARYELHKCMKTPLKPFPQVPLGAGCGALLAVHQNNRKRSNGQPCPYLPSPFSGGPQSPHLLAAAVASYCSGIRRHRSPVRNSGNNYKPEPTAGNV
ncbi:hypothetical protein P7K49_017870 [Saguinus oedipus]|uniref:Uncharacterized protein n=1 Tax=Saguinus oedipus TaxID=9490 RepID=A0ABQ9V3S3_SAGOE|nr:hypothetical protein P7K49_017870 [Saguinus oedipus]